MLNILGIFIIYELNNNNLIYVFIDLVRWNGIFFFNEEYVYKI